MSPAYAIRLKRSSPREAPASIFLWVFFGSTPGRCCEIFLVVAGLDGAPRDDRGDPFALLKDLEKISHNRSHRRIHIAMVGRPEVRNESSFRKEKYY